MLPGVELGEGSLLYRVNLEQKRSWINSVPSIKGPLRLCYLRGVFVLSLMCGVLVTIFGTSAKVGCRKEQVFNAKNVDRESVCL